MSLLPECTLAGCFGQAYTAGRSLHGNLGLPIGRYSDRVNEILEKCLGASPVERRAVNFFKHLHSMDLYLATACALPSETAWGRFDHLYHSYLRRVAGCVCATTDAAEDLAEGLPGYLFLRDQAGHTGIGGFDGRSSLASWLSVIVNHQATNERLRKCNTVERLEDLPEMADETVVRRIENELRADRYGPLIKETFTTAGLELSNSERLILVLRYEEGLQGAEIAQLLHVHPSTITRNLKGIYEKVREQVLATLDTQHHLNRPAIEECVAEILAHPDACAQELFNAPDEGRVQIRQVQAKAMACVAG
jgi:RNA polymerase sigma factor (sigma-70 family)